MVRMDEDESNKEGEMYPGRRGHTCPSTKVKASPHVACTMEYTGKVTRKETKRQAKPDGEGLSLPD